MGTGSRSQLTPVHGISLIEWETLWAPYDRVAYQSVLDSLAPDDIVLEIGAGIGTMIDIRAHGVHTIYRSK